jgi:hypothetical protein
MKNITLFWNWFQDNNQTIKNLGNETPKIQKHICFWLNRHLGYYCKGLDFIIAFPKKENQKAELIITANGNPENFNQVITLIDNAPQLKHWKFTAFIQPKENIEKIMEGLDNPYIFPEITIKTSDIKFLPLNYDEEKNKFDITVYLKNYNIHCNTKTWNQVIYIILQDLLGEKLLYKNINFVQLAQMPESTEELIELYDLQFFIDSFNLL